MKNRKHEIPKNEKPKTSVKTESEIPKNRKMKYRKMKN